MKSRARHALGASESGHRVAARVPSLHQLIDLGLASPCDFPFRFSIHAVRYTEKHGVSRRWSVRGLLPIAFGIRAVGGSGPRLTAYISTNRGDFEVERSS